MVYDVSSIRQQEFPIGAAVQIAYELIYIIIIIIVGTLVRSLARSHRCISFYTRKCICMLHFWN